MALNDSSELLALIRRRGSIPSNNPDWTSALVLEQATRELLETHLPLLMAARGEYLVKSVDLPLVAATSRYRLPARCAGVRMVSYLDATGALTPLNDAGPTENTNDRINVNQVGRPGRFTFAENSLELWPIPGSAGDSIRVKYHLRPSRICVTTECAVITVIAVDTPTAGKTTITYATPSGTAFWTAAGRKDFVKATSPFDLLSFNVLPTASTATTNVFTSSELSADIEVGDYVCPANYSAFPNVPVELHQPIALRAAAAIVSPKGDGLAKALVDEAVTKERQLLIGILAPRSKGNRKTIRSTRWG